MVVYNLICEHEHRFEGWFGSGDDFASQHADGHVDCPVCGTRAVKKLPTASHVKTRGEPSSAEYERAQLQMQELRRKMADYVQHNTEDVGARFAEEARKIHYQEIEAKGIRGTATKQEVEDLSEEGIEVFALPGALRLPEKLH